MEITRALHADHKELKAYLKTINESEDRREIEVAFGQFAALLKKHAKAEEKVVYDALIETDETKKVEDGMEGYTEHMLADTLLKKLEAGVDPLSPEWKAEAKVMREILLRHIDEEEDDVFKDVKKSFDSEERAEMGEEFEELKKEISA